jgi:predicted lipid-binding transport protein (Tim44 family)
MGELYQYIDVILFAMVAGFLVLRLRSVLGRRTGNERRRDPFPQRAPTRPDTVVTLPEPGKSLAAPVIEAEPANPVADGLMHIRRADPGFDPASFSEGARIAFEMVVTAFAKGDKAALRSLLSDEVFVPFAGAIDERLAAKETLETRIVHLRSADIVEAGLDGQTARVTVKFVSEQINLTRAVDGSIVDGDPDQPAEKTDYWTFARDTRSSDPNWVLVATSSG